MFALALLLTVAAVGVFFLFEQPEVALEVCARQPLCATCVSCASADPHPCAAPRRACDADPACHALSTCLADCLGAAELGLGKPPPEAPACFDRCRDTHADGLDAWCAFGRCAYGEACATACADPVHGALACE